MPNDEDITNLANNSDNCISIINLELVNKNDKKLIKLNSTPNRLGQHNTYDLVDSIKTKINKIISDEANKTSVSFTSANLPTSQPKSSSPHPIITYVCLQDESEPESSLSSRLNDSVASSLSTDANRSSGSEAGDFDELYRPSRESKGYTNKY